MNTEISPNYIPYKHSWKELQKMERDQNNVPQFSEEKVNELKSQFGKKLRVVTIKDSEGNEVNFAVITPNRNVVDAMTHHGAKNDYAKAQSVLIQNCVKAGDMELIDDDGAVYVALSAALGGFVSAATAEIKKP